MVRQIHRLLEVHQSHRRRRRAVRRTRPRLREARRQTRPLQTLRPQTLRFVGRSPEGDAYDAARSKRILSVQLRIKPGYATYAAK